MTKNKILKYIVLISGFLSLGLGIIGIFVPILPTTPFVLLAAMCFFHSSPKLYEWLINKKYFGKIIKDYREGKGLSNSVVAISISFLWVMMLFSILFATNTLWLKILLIIIGISVTIHILRTRKKEDLI